MPDYRKPIPKSQKDISQELVNPSSPDQFIFASSDNINLSTQIFDYVQLTWSQLNIIWNDNPYVWTADISTLQSSFTQPAITRVSPDQTGIDFNRSEKLSRKGDNYKDFTVGLEDIDTAIMYYFDNVIRPFVYQNGQRIPVPIVYGSPERWKSVQKDGYYRDSKGAIMMPIIVFKRNSVAKNRTLTNKLDANHPNVYATFQKSYNDKNFYSNFSVLNNRKPTKQFVANVVPDYVDIQYSVIIQTYYIEQLNKIVEAINYASDSYWGDPERFKFKSRIDSFNTVNEVTQGEYRSVRSTFDINLFGYIVPDTIQKNVSSIKKYNEKSTVTFSIETTTKNI